MTKELRYLFGKRRFGRKPGLKQISALLGDIGNPEKQFKSVHIAGTNGKGSTAAILQSILIASGKNVGLNTSPHRIRFHERIRINEREISDGELAKQIREMKPYFEKHKTTFFECTTALAFRYFAEQKVDCAMVEVGLGGRLDGTNVILPETTIITSVGIDHHTNILGTTVEEIAREKAGIIKKNTPVFCGNLPKNAQAEVLKIAKKNNSSVRQVEPFTVKSISQNGTEFEWRGERFCVGLAGHHQAGNAVLAGMVAREIFNLPMAKIRAGMGKTSWAGRLEIISQNPLIIYDVAHNIESVSSMVCALKQIYPKQKFHGVIALKPQKEHQKILQMVQPIMQNMTFIEFFEEACATPDELVRIWIEMGGNLAPEQRLEDVFANATQSKTPIIVFGSHFLAQQLSGLKSMLGL